MDHDRSHGRRPPRRAALRAAARGRRPGTGCALDSFESRVPRHQRGRISSDTLSINAAPNAEPVYSEAVTFTAVATDVDGDPLCWLWSDKDCGGSFSSASTPTTIWTAPTPNPSRLSRERPGGGDSLGGTIMRTCMLTVFGGVASVLLAAAPARSEGCVRLLDEDLHLRELSIQERSWRGSMADLSLPSSRASVRLAASPDDQGGEEQGSSKQDETGTERKKPEERPGAGPEKPDALEFDLLGAPAKPPRVDDRALRLRRTMLSWHQGVGLGMFALQLATTIVGQLNYNDKFGSDNTGQFVQPHAILAYSTLAAFAAAGTLALFAPAPLRRSEGFDRVSLHKLSMWVATAGMVAEGVLGIWTTSREGHFNQQGIATAHLVIGYVTLAAVAAGVGALVF